MAVKANYLPYKLLQLLLLAIIFVFVPSISLAGNTLKQGDALNTSSFLTENYFALGFQWLGDREPNNSYFGIWLNDPVFTDTKPFWIGNRDQPIADNSGMFSIDGSGTLKLSYSGGDLVEFYSSGGSSSVNNLAAVLNETGDLVLKDARSGKVLWESFDHPTDTLLPRMKLGTNHRTGKSTTLLSWLSASIPSSGAFTLEWNSTSQQFVVKRRGVTFWTSSLSQLGLHTKLSFGDAINIHNNEDYITYTVNDTLDQRSFTMWRLEYDGSIHDLHGNTSILDASNCDGNSTENGCKRWEGPECRNGGSKFELRFGDFYIGDSDILQNSSLSISDCKDMCWKNCSCVATDTLFSDGTGCAFYYGSFAEDGRYPYNVIIRPVSDYSENILNQGEALDTSSSLTKNYFTLGFQSLGDQGSKGDYLGIWLNDSPFTNSKPFWIGNRDRPIADNSGMFSIDGSGTLKINYSGGDLVELYSSSRSFSSCKLAAVLEETGDLVLKDASSDHVLWESFDDPTDSLLPGMKLGTNHTTGKSRTLLSWLSDSIPSSGAFTLEWNSTSQQLFVKRRGATFWTSIPLELGHDASDLGLSDDYIFFDINGDYFTYKLHDYFTTWRLQYDGSIHDLHSNTYVLDASKCDGSSTENGCKRWEGPECRNGGNRFDLRSGTFNLGDPEDFYDNSSLSISDCKDMCWKNCSCVGTDTIFSNGTGCAFYYGSFTEKISDSDASYVSFNVIMRPESNNSGYSGTSPNNSGTLSDNSVKRKWIWISAAVAFALIAALLTFLVYLRKKRNTKRRLLNELLRMDMKEEGDDNENDSSNRGHNLKFYGVTTIMAATNNFCPENKLGQGGFGPVYKGKLQEGKEIAVKRLSRSSGQGMVEFKNELILIAKLQHTNLVRLLGCCIHGEEKMLVYEYMPNKSLDCLSQLGLHTKLSFGDAINIHNNEDYITYTVNDTLDQRSFTMWRLEYDGSIHDLHSNTSILDASNCDGNSTENGCKRWEGPKCRNGGNRFASRSGYFDLDRVPYHNSSLSISDCKDMCWKNCSCAGTGPLYVNGTGCAFFYGNFYEDGSHPYNVIIRPELSGNTLNQGQALNASSSLTENYFTLGFQWLGDGDSNYSYLGIWPNDSKPFWIGNRDRPIADKSGMFSIDGSGTLKINYLGGDLVEFYSSGGSSSVNNLAAVLEETGDLVLKDASSGKVLWESFDDPTDSLLPGMELGTNHTTGKSRTLLSWLSDSIPSSGAFTLEWNFTSQQLVVKRRGVTFWTSTPLELDHDASDLGLGDAILFDIHGDYFTYIVQDSSFTTWRLQYDGSIHDLHSNTYVLDASKCDGSSTENGCKRWEGPECRNGGNGFESRSGYFDLGDPQVFYQNSSLSISDCKDICWKNCSCGGTNTLFSNGTGCAFYYGGFTETISDAHASYEFFNVIIRPEPNNSGTSPNNSGYSGTPSDNSVKRKWIWISAAVAFALIAALLTFLVYLRKKRNTKKRLLNELLRMDMKEDGDDIENDSSNRGHNLKFYGVTTIMAATNNFCPENKLGQGGFGPVYKGKLQEGKEIAVKRLSRSSGQGMVEFKNELILIAKLQHTNLVRLLGCCIHGEERMLVYEYMPNKSLDWFIFDESKKKLLDWNKRLEIIEGIAQGMLYLHKYSRLRIIHRDLKTSNILLDDNLNPKISDFGMARIFKTNTIEANTNRVVGTYGYMSPEYAMEGIFSVKSDVFSFGVLMLEIISGRKNHGILYVDRPVNLVGYAWELWKQGNALELMDPTLIDSCSKNLALRCIQVGLLCVEDSAQDRPIMSDVITMLTSEASQLPSPKQPAFTKPRGIVDVPSNIKPVDISANEMTMSMSIMEAR